MNGQRVTWRHDCPNPSHCGYESGGIVWAPASGADPYLAAKTLGLTADPAPEPGRPYAMVAFDCRRAVLQMHYWDELETVAEVSP